MYITGPCVDIDTNERESYNFDQDEELKNFRSIPIRNGGIARLLFQCLLILIKGSVFNGIKNFALSAAICQSSDLGTPSTYKYNRKESSQNLDLVKLDLKESRSVDREFDISSLLNMLSMMCFPSLNNSSPNPLRKMGIDTNQDSIAFYLPEMPEFNNPRDLKDQRKYFDISTFVLIPSEECVGTCLFHNTVKVKGNLLNEI